MLHDACDFKAGKMVRRLAVGEIMEWVEGPVEDKEVGLLRVKVTLKKDAAAHAILLLLHVHVTNTNATWGGKERSRGTLQGDVQSTHTIST